MLDAYVKFARAHKPRLILIGGFFADSAFFIENQVRDLDLDFEPFNN